MDTYNAIKVGDLVVVSGEFVSLTSWGLGNVSGEVGLISVVGGALYIFLRGGVTVRSKINRDGTGLGEPRVSTNRRR